MAQKNDLEFIQKLCSFISKSYAIYVICNAICNAIFVTTCHLKPVINTACFSRLKTRLTWKWQKF